MSLQVTPTPNQTNHEDHGDNRIKWPYFLCINFLLFLAFFWFLYCFVKYQLTASSTAPTWMTLYLKWCAILSCVCTIAHLLTTEALIVAGRLDSFGEHVCNVLSKLYVCTYYLCSFPIFMFFWMRQKFLYKQNKLPIANQSLMMKLSQIALGVNISGILLAQFLESVYTSSHMSDRGCMR